MKKLTGYLISFAGLAGLAISTVKNTEAVKKIGIPEFLFANNLSWILSTILIAIGLFLIFTDSGSDKNKKGEEVPIYDQKGKKVVGYRRL